MRLTIKIFIFKSWSKWHGELLFFIYMIKSLTLKQQAGLIVDLDKRLKLKKTMTQLNEKTLSTKFLKMKPDKTFIFKNWSKIRSELSNMKERLKF